MSTFHLKPIRSKVTAKQKVYKEIKKIIFHGGLTPEDVFTEVKLAKRLNTSRTPIREALQDLVKEGLLVPIPRKGIAVRKLTEDEIEQILLLRTAVESAIIKKLAATVSSKQIDELKRICMQQEEAMRMRDEAAFIQLDQVFHLTLARFVNYYLVEQVLLNLHDLSKLIGLEALKKHNRMNEVLSEHLEIIGALARNDAESASGIMVAHLVQTKASLKKGDEMNAVRKDEHIDGHFAK